MENYNEFKDSLERLLNEGLKKYDAENYVCEFGVMNKVNSAGEECVILRDSEKLTDVAARISMKDLYRDYQRGMSVEEIAITIVERRIMSERVINTDDMMNRIYSRDFLLENSDIQVISKELNRELLESVPYRDIEGFDDLAVIVRCDASVFFDESIMGDTSANILINDKVLVVAGITEKELMDRAIHNSEERHPVVLKDLLGMVHEIEEDRGMDDMFGLPEQSPLYVMMASDVGCNGARVLAFSNFKETIKNKFGEDCYILPSSVHEVLIMPESMSDCSEGYILNMVHAVNSDVLDPRDLLSDNIYKYEAATDSIRTITGSLEKASEKETGMEM